MNLSFRGEIVGLGGLRLGRLETFTVSSRRYSRVNGEGSLYSNFGI